MNQPDFVDTLRDGVTIVYAMKPWLIEPPLADHLTRRLTDALDAGANPLLVDLSNVERLSSVFIRSFLAAGKKARQQDAVLAFCGVAGSLREIFELTGLDRLYPFFASESEAVEELTRAR